METNLPVSLLRSAKHTIAIYSAYHASRYIHDVDPALTMWMFGFFNLINGGFLFPIFSIWSDYKTYRQPIRLELELAGPEVERGNGPFNLPIFDHQHSPQNITAYAYLLGSGVGLGLGMAWLCPTLTGFGVFLAALGLFHILEYLTTAMFQQRRGGLSCGLFWRLRLQFGGRC